MSIGQEWTRAVRDVHGVFLAIRTSLGSVWADKNGKRSKGRTVHVYAMRSMVITDHRILVELERKKSLALLNNAHSLVR